MKKYSFVCIHTINNLTGPDTNLLDLTAASGIAQLIRENMLFANINTLTYDKKSITHLIANKTAQTIRDRLHHGFLVYVTGKDSHIAGCAMLIKHDERYFAKTLHIHQDFRGRGLARLLCLIRENLLRSMGVKELYIESLLFPGTIAFHKKRGFREIKPYRKLYYSILMKKEL